MKTNRTILIMALVAVLVAIGAFFLFRPPMEKPVLKPTVHTAAKKEMLIYFSKMKGSDIVTDPVKRPMPNIKSNQYLVEYAMQELLKGPSEEEKDAGYFSEIPPGTKLIGIEKTKQGFRINLSEKFTNGGGSNSMIQRLEEVTKTVASLPQGSPVYLDVEGKQLEVLGGEGVMVNEPITASPSVQQ